MARFVQFEGEIRCEKNAEKTCRGGKKEVDRQTSEAKKGQISGDASWEVTHRYAALAKHAIRCYFAKSATRIGRNEAIAGEKPSLYFIAFKG